MNKLVFINGLGPNYKGDNMYEFIFSEEIEEVWGDGWESKPSSGYPTPPELKHIKKVGVLRNTNIKLELVQNSDFFSMVDAVDDIIALAWETDETDNKRLVFRFGDDEQSVKDKLYERDIVLEFEKKMIYEA